MSRKVKIPKTWKTSEGKQVRICQMNTYHLQNALRKVIRYYVRRAYDQRRLQGYQRSLSDKVVLKQINEKLCNNDRYLAVFHELVHRADCINVQQYVIYIIHLCKERWALERRWNKLNDMLR